MLTLSACTLSDAPAASPIPITNTPAIPTTSPASPAAPTPTSAPTVLPDLRSDPGPFTDAAWLLDGVCFEALARLNGESWSWGTTGALNAFFDRIADSGLCDAPVTRSTFDFTNQMLVGAVQTVQGCDAAHRLIDVVQDDAAQTRTLVLALEVRPGCPYELVQVFLVAVPRLPESYTTTVQLN